MQRDVDNLKNALRVVDVNGAFITAVAPGSMIPERDDRYYRTEEEGLFAAADALHEEYRRIVDAGFILQVDDAYLASWHDIMRPAALTKITSNGPSSALTRSTTRCAACPRIARACMCAGEAGAVRIRTTFHFATLPIWS